MASVSLAEPRRRQKWTLNPRGEPGYKDQTLSSSIKGQLIHKNHFTINLEGNLWANDENKFGHKLMEKMGWEKGKGLGANQVNTLSKRDFERWKGTVSQLNLAAKD